MTMWETKAEEKFLISLLPTALDKSLKQSDILLGTQLYRC